MDYEKKYKGALERVRRLHDRMLVLSSTDALVASAELEFIFPELKESEDERIRKSLVQTLQLAKCNDGKLVISNTLADKYLAWLEKQKECLADNSKTSTDEDEMIRKELIGALMWQRDCLDAKGPHDNELILPGFTMKVGDILEWLEKQKESLHISETCKESADSFTDDERIRKKLIEIIGYFRSRGIDQQLCEEFIAYLENQKPSFKQIHDSVMWDNGLRAGIELGKQKEQKDYNKLYENIGKSEWFKKAYEGKSLGCDYEQKEQKPVSISCGHENDAEWSEEEVLNRTYEEGFNDGLKYRKPVKRSDEDKKMSDWLIGLVNANTELSFKDKVNLTRWLEHLTIEKELSKNDK